MRRPGAIAVDQRRVPDRARDPVPGIKFLRRRQRAAGARQRPSGRRRAADQFPPNARRRSRSSSACRRPTRRSARWRTARALPGVVGGRAGTARRARHSLVAVAPARRRSATRRSSWSSRCARIHDPFYSGSPARPPASSTSSTASRAHLPVVLAIVVVLDADRPVPDDRLGRAAGQGGADELLSLSAMLGILVLIFQDGQLQGLLGFQRGRARRDPADLPVRARLRAGDRLRRVPALADQGGARRGASDSEAVAIGLERTGRIVTAAAILFAVAIGAFATSQDRVHQGARGRGRAGRADRRFVVRALLVPSLMELLGPWNWWAPKPLRRLHERIGLREGGPLPRDVVMAVRRQRSAVRNRRSAVSGSARCRFRCSPRGRARGLPACRWRQCRLQR